MICPCCSGLPYEVCCKPLHKGTEPPTALQLMRSRYSAYALGLADYIQKTTHSKSPYFETNKAHWRQEIETFCRTTQFIKLEIRGFGETWVSFAAHLKQGGKEIVLQELSQFEQENSHWRYLNGKVAVS